MHTLAHEAAGEHWLALGGGGYAIAQVVPLVWTHLLALAAHEPVGVDAQVPQVWRDDVRGPAWLPDADADADGRRR